MINGIIHDKLSALKQAIAELNSLGSVSTAQIEQDWRTQRAIERNLQIMVETVIDICQRLSLLMNQPPAKTSFEAIQNCIQLGALHPQDTATYRKMVQFRNFIVHRYEKVDVSILAEMVNRRLPDFERFHDQIFAYVARH